MSPAIRTQWTQSYFIIQGFVWKCTCLGPRLVRSWHSEDHQATATQKITKRLRFLNCWLFLNVDDLAWGIRRGRITEKVLSKRLKDSLKRQERRKGNPSSVADVARQCDNPLLHVGFPRVGNNTDFETRPLLSTLLLWAGLAKFGTRGYASFNIVLAVLYPTPSPRGPALTLARGHNRDFLKISAAWHII